ncbi:hypothetical protein [Streptomyces wedmorensis]|uniref:hypothetical protein n=1 Tax=Streptomyces wedmorensis TaxID=43759 RepID=UPI0037BAD5D8
MLRTEIGPGPTERELDAVEKRFGFTFSTDHRVFLGAGLPHGSSRWPDWRDGAAQDLEGRLAWPVEGVLFDVERSGFRHRAWPSRPAEKSEALRVARTELESVPQLVPVYGHRYPPGTAGEHGHPTDTTDLPREAARWELVRWWLRLIVNGSLAPAPAVTSSRTKAGPLWPGYGPSGHWSTGPTPTTTRRRTDAQTGNPWRTRSSRRHDACSPGPGRHGGDLTGGRRGCRHGR